MRIIDLTLPVVTGMSVPPAAQKAGLGVEIKTVSTHKEKGIKVSTYSTVIHAGTHVDAPEHVFEGGKSVDQTELTNWVGFGKVISVVNKKENEPITRDDLSSSGKIEPRRMLLIHTGWSDRMWGTKRYWDSSPYLTKDAAEWLVEQKPKAVGYDFFQELAAKQEIVRAEDFDVHKMILGNGISNIEHLTNLGKIFGGPLIVAVPLKLVGAEGSPARVIAIEM